MSGSVVVGAGDVISFEEMRPGEQVIIMALEQAQSMGYGTLHIRDLQAVAGWDGSAGNSKVRNNLRRLVRLGVVHRPEEGTYALTRGVERNAPASAPLVQLQVNRSGPNPRNVNEIERKLLSDVERGVVSFKQAATVKKSDCSFYNACLSQAISGKWAGFSCGSCTSYAEPDAFQKESDMLALRALGTAAEMLEEHGKINRIRGVKPGADAKRTVVDHDDL